MRFLHITTTGIQLIFIILVFVLVFYRPKENNKNVLGLSIDVRGVLQACHADVNRDRLVDFTDYLYIKEAMTNTTNDSIKYDLTEDNIVDLSDFALIYSQFGQYCK